jgi:hypothetical protein
MNNLTNLIDMERIQEFNRLDFFVCQYIEDLEYYGRNSNRYYNVIRKYVEATATRNNIDITSEEFENDFAEIFYEVEKDVSDFIEDNIPEVIEMINGCRNKDQLLTILNQFYYVFV